MAVEHAVEAIQRVARTAPHAPQTSENIQELPNVITVLHHRWHEEPVVAWLHRWENAVFAGIIGLLLCGLAWRYARRPARVPRRGQNVVEFFVDGLDRFVQGVIGPDGRRYTPFIGTLFIYIWFINLSGLIPGFKSATASLNTTIGLACTVFGYVQWIGIRRNGVLGYLAHLAGSPRGVTGWALAPLLLPLHLIGEFIKPLSLSLRLGFNILAEDVLLAVLVGLGITAGMALHLPVGLPIQFFVVPLVLIFSTVQALVFSLLSTVYISLMLPHGEQHEPRGGSHA